MHIAKDLRVRRGIPCFQRSRSYRGEVLKESRSFLWNRLNTSV